ncbi:blue copper domain-containing protein [Natrinema gari JCM 14663]|uniref:Blue copper domain-containing protein n=2 Tax=Natrinema gari TaxID=419186 RepID=L9YTG8_9EURY|nr:blue copper domain-containing protein [Natrinema gari JCM 14663]
MQSTHSRCTTMTQPDEEKPEESIDEPMDDLLDAERRPLLKALGAGVTVSVGSGIAAARSDATADSSGAVDTGSDAAALDPQYGFATPDADTVPEGLAPDHIVALHTDMPADPEDPDRPPFFHFEPSGIHVDPGDVVQFTATAPDHTITAYHPAQGFQRRVPDGVPPFSSPVLNVGGAWLYAFPKPGIYDVYCASHHVFGMSMRLVVGDLPAESVPDYEETFEGSDDPPLLPPFSPAFLEHELNTISATNEDCDWPWLTPQEVLDAPALDPMRIQKRGTVSFGDVLADIDRFAEVWPLHDDTDDAASADESSH